MATARTAESASEGKWTCDPIRRLGSRLCPIDQSRYVALDVSRIRKYVSTIKPAPTRSDLYASDRFLDRCRLHGACHLERHRPLNEPVVTPRFLLVEEAEETFIGPNDPGVLPRCFKDKD